MKMSPIRARHKVYYFERRDGGLEFMAYVYGQQVTRVYYDMLKQDAKKDFIAFINVL
jgi:hypothetical protein